VASECGTTIGVTRTCREDALLPVASQRALSPDYNQSTFVDKLKHRTSRVRAVLVDEVDMIAEPKHEAQRDDTVRGGRIPPTLLARVDQVIE
jgi:hypothetical protein